MSENSKFNELVNRFEKCIHIRKYLIEGTMFEPKKYLIKFILDEWSGKEELLNKRVEFLENDLYKYLFFEYKQTCNRFTGYLVDYPEAVSEGSTLEELKINLIDALYCAIKAKNSGNQ